MMQNSSLDSILRIGEVWSVDGRSVRIKVDENKNVSHLLYCGTVIKNPRFNNEVQNFRTE